MTKAKDIWGDEGSYKQARKTRGDAFSNNNEMGDTPLVRNAADSWDADDRAQYSGIDNEDKVVTSGVREVTYVSKSIGKGMHKDGLLDSSGYDDDQWAPGPLPGGKSPPRFQNKPSQTTPVDAYSPRDKKYAKLPGRAGNQRSGD